MVTSIQEVSELLSEQVVDPETTRALVEYGKLNIENT